MKTVTGQKPCVHGFGERYIATGTGASEFLTLRRSRLQQREQRSATNRTGSSHVTSITNPNRRFVSQKQLKHTDAGRTTIVD